MNKIDLRQGDCLEVMKDIPDGSVDAIITDPPYGYSFMGLHAYGVDTLLPDCVHKPDNSDPYRPYERSYSLRMGGRSSNILSPYTALAWLYHHAVCLVFVSRLRGASGLRNHGSGISGQSGSRRVWWSDCKTQSSSDEHKPSYTLFAFLRSLHRSLNLAIASKYQSFVLSLRSVVQYPLSQLYRSTP